MIALLLACSTSGDAGVSAETLTLIYSNNVDGEIEPCG